MIILGCTPRSNLCESIHTISDKEINEIIYAVITTDTLANYHEAFKKENKSGILNTSLRKVRVILNESEWKQIMKFPGPDRYDIDKCEIIDICNLLGVKSKLTKEDSLYFVCYNNTFLKNKTLDTTNFRAYNIGFFDSLNKLNQKIYSPIFSIPILYANQTKACVLSGRIQSYDQIYLEKRNNNWHVVRHRRGPVQ